MHVNNYSRGDFEQVPWRESWDTDIGLFDSLIILPARINTTQLVWYNIRKAIARLLKLSPPERYEVDGLHDSGYQQMSYIAVSNGFPFIQLGGGSDVLHIEGIGGHGEKDRQRIISGRKLLDSIHIAGWSFDCLPNSGLLRLFPRNRMKIKAGASLSSFEIYSVPKESN